MRRFYDLLGVVGSMPSDKLSLIAFQHLDELNARARALIEPNTELVHAFLRDHTDLLDCVVPPRSMVVFPRLKHQADSEPLHDLLRQFETSIVPGKYFEHSEHFRLGFAVKTEDVATGLHHLSQALKTLG
jgi:aspartate/methionine/tyrosine aminotransferase